MKNVLLLTASAALLTACTNDQLSKTTENWCKNQPNCDAGEVPKNTPKAAHDSGNQHQYEWRKQ